MKKIITTVGTSLASNYLKKYRTLTHYELIKEKPSREYENEKRKIKRIKKELSNFVKKKENACAEITSINKVKEKYPNEELKVVLLASDTLGSILISEVLKDVLKEILVGKIEVSFDKENNVINCLKVDKKEHFVKGVNNLIDKIFNIIKKNDSVLKPQEVIFNITGGYKGTIPYFSTIAQIFDYEIVYTFEDNANTKELLELKPLPIEIDRGMLELYYPYLDNINLINNEEVKNRLIELGLFDGTNLTPIGKIALLTVKNTPLSKDVFGHFIEYKVYEFFVKMYFNNIKSCECLEDFSISSVGHGENLGKNLSDIDILLEDKNNEIVWVEVKPIMYLIDEKKNNELIKQIQEKQLNKWSESSKFKEKTLKKYLLVIYGYSKDNINQNCIDGLQEIFKEKNIKFDICYFEIKLAKSDKRNKKTITSATYQTIMKDYEIKKLERITNVQKS